MQHPTQFMSLNFKSRVPIEFRDINLICCKLESLMYIISRKDLFNRGCSVAKRSIQLSYKRVKFLYS